MTSSKYLSKCLSKALKARTSVGMSGKVLKDFEPYAIERGYRVSISTRGADSHKPLYGACSPKGWYSVAVYC